MCAQEQSAHCTATCAQAHKMHCTEIGSWMGVQISAQGPSVLIFPQSTCLLPFDHCLIHHLFSIYRTWSLQPRWTRCRCNNFAFQVLVVLFLPISMSMALSSFHKFLAFGLPNRSPTKLSFDLISEGIHLSSHILIKLGVLIMDFRRVIGPRDARMESLENLKSFHDFFLFPVSLIRGKTEPEQFAISRYRPKGTASRDVGAWSQEDSQRIMFGNIQAVRIG